MTALALGLARLRLSAPPGPWPERPLDSHDWEQLRSAVRRNKLTGLLVEAITDGLLPVTADQYDHAVTWHEQALSTVLVLDRQLVRVVPALRDAGVDVLALKGPALAHLDYREPSLRLYGDIDLLLRSSQFARGLQVLDDLGFERPWGEMRPGFDARFGKGATLVGPDELQLDVHRTFVFGAFGLAIQLDDLFADPDHVTIGGQRIAVLGRPQRLLHACYHAALGDVTPRLSSLRDIALLWPAGPDGRRELDRLAGRWQGDVVVDRARRLAEEALGVRLERSDAAPPRGHPPSRRDRRAMDTYVGTRRSFGAQVLASLPYLAGVRDRVALLAAVASPDRGPLRARGATGRFAWLRRGLASISGRGRA